MNYRAVFFQSLLPLLAILCVDAGASTLLSADFNTDESGFNYVDDPFLGTSQPEHASGERTASGGYGGTGGLQVLLGGVVATTNGSSGAWHYTLNTAVPRTGVSVTFKYTLQIDALYRYDQYGRVMLTLDGTTFGRGSKAYIDHIGGSPSLFTAYAPTTDWQQEVIYVGDLTAGAHELQIGAYNNRLAAIAAPTTLVLDDVVVTDGSPAPVISVAQTLVNRLSLERFKRNIEVLSAFGDRLRYSESPICPSLGNSFCNAQSWVAQQLAEDGFDIEYHHTVRNERDISNLFVTKIGTIHPDRMYILGAHLDGRGGGGAADDDGSGVSLLLEMAHVLGSPDVVLDTSVRLIFWDREEALSVGSAAYVAERRTLQGIEDPAGSGHYPEPSWMGMLQHDMILYDHGEWPPSILQSEYADLDVEWANQGAMAAQSRSLALVWQHLNGTFSSRYPSTAYNESSSTDDGPFRNYCPAVSVRENRRLSDYEWNNPNWHQATDLYQNYSEADFELGFNAVQASLGAVAKLTNARIVNLQNEIFQDGFDQIQAPKMSHKAKLALPTRISKVPPTSR